MIIEAFCDGGVARQNPSPICGSWAYILIDDRHVTHREDFGVILPSYLGKRTVTNNDTEFLAVLMALEYLPDGWEGDVYSDSQCTLRRYAAVAGGRPPTKTMHQELYERAEAAMARLGEIRFCHVKGHAKRKDLLDGKTKDSKGRLISPYQDRADRLCSEAADGYVRMLELMKRGDRPA